MKRKKINPKQWSLERCVEYTVAALGNEDREALVADMDFYLHSSLGRWIRNNCDLWEHGTDRCVDDIVREYKNGKLSSKHLDENQFTHCQLSFNWENIGKNPARRIISSITGYAKTIGIIDCTLEHPDNCSAVIIEAVVQRLINGTD